VDKKTEYIVLAFIGVVICDKLIFPSKPITQIKYVTNTEVKTEVHTVYVETKKANVATKSITEKIDSHGSVVERTTTNTVDLSVTNLNLGVDTKIHATSSTEQVIKERNESWLLGFSLRQRNPSSLENWEIVAGYRTLGNIWLFSSVNLGHLVDKPISAFSVGLLLTL
jgi:hypothetical protein